MADSYVYQNAGRATISDVNSPFLNKRVVYVQDEQNGSYPSNQCSIQTNILTNSSLWCDYSQSYLEIPIVVAFYPKAIAYETGKNFSNSAVNDSFQIEQYFCPIRVRVCVCLLHATVSFSMA